MKNYLATLVCVLISGALLAAGGCVPQQDYDKALDLNRKSQTELQNCRAKVRTLDADKQAMSDQLKVAEAQARKAESDAAALLAARDALQAKFKDLMDKYEAELKKDRGTPPIADFILPMRVDKALKAFAQANPGLVDYQAKHGMIKIKSELTFERGSTIVKAAAVEALGKLVAITNDPVIAKYHVYIAGHTDNIPIRRPATAKRHPDNWYLSAHRAVAVKKVMQKAGLVEQRIGVMGFGEYHPIAPNKTSSTGKKLGNVLNRRVEIWIVPPDRFLTSTAASGGAK